MSPPSGPEPYLVDPSGEGDAPPSRRAAIPGLSSPAPFLGRLPALYADGDFAGRFVAAFDDVLAPVFATLDCLEAYLDPRLAPPDFLDLLGWWTAAGVQHAQPASLPARRAIVANAVPAHLARGTVRGLEQSLRRMFGVAAEITDNGGAAWSPTPAGPLPGTPEPYLRVRIRAAGPDPLPVRRIAAFIEAERPAHVPVRVEVIDQDG
jgi:phage tail-like protein